MHFKLKVNCKISIPKLKLKSKNKTFGIPKVYQNLKVILVKIKLKLKLNFDTKTALPLWYHNIK